jgi:hypothetical protein
MKRLLLCAGAGAFALAMAACAKDASTGPTMLTLQLSSADSAALLTRESGDATVADVNLMNDTVTTAGCTLNPATGRFDCPPFVNEHGLTVTRSLAFFDAHGVLMNHFDSTTASMNVQATAIGIATRENGADTVSRMRNLTATGLLGHNTTRTWNGTASGTGGGYGADSIASRTFDVSNNSVLSAIVVALPRSANPWPLSGTISRVVTGTGTVTKGDITRTVTISRDVGITFNGTEFVPMMIGTVAYTLDLATGKATKN